MKFNDFNYRIKVLFKSVKSYLAYNEIKKGVSTEKKIIDENGKETTQIEFGGGQINEDEIITAQVEINSILDNLANLKDNLRKELHSIGLDEQIVEGYINNNQSLQLITDLDNSNKHGYPLKKNRRSKLDPKIENIRHEFVFPLGIGWTNMHANGKVIYEADVNDKNGNRIFYFRELIENAIELWEEFIIKYLPEKASDITKKRKDKNQEELLFKKRLELQNKADKIISIEENWLDIDHEALKGGMYLKVLDKASKKELYRGVAITNKFEKKGAQLIKIKNGFVHRLINTFKVIDKDWKLLSFENKEEYEMFNNHYLDLEELNRK